MGLFDFAKKNLGAIAGVGLGGGMLGGLVGHQVDKARGGGGGEDAGIAQQRAEMDKYQRMVDDARDKYQGEAQQYRQKLPGLQRSLGEQAAGAGRQELAGNLVQSTRGMNKRGLLYSGLQQQGQNQQKGKFYSDLASKQNQINEQTEGQARELEDKAMQAGLQAQQARIGNVNNAYNTALAQKLGQQQGNQGLFGSILGAAGGLLGKLG